MNSLHEEITAVIAIASATYAADTTPVAIDLSGYRNAEIILEIGAGGITFSGSNKVEFVLTHSDDDSVYANVTDADVVGVTGISNGIIKSLIAAHASATVSRFGYRGIKRYLKLLADFGGTHGTGTPISAVVIKAGGRYKPEANQT